MARIALQTHIISFASFGIVYYKSDNERKIFFLKKRKRNFILWYDEKSNKMLVKIKIMLQALKEGGAFWKTWKQVLHRLKTNVSLIIMSQALEQRFSVQKQNTKNKPHLW